MSGTSYAGGASSRYLLMGSTLLLLMGGLVMVYSASSVADYVNFSDSAYHFKRHAISILIGAIALFVAQAFDYRKLRRMAWAFYFGCIASLVAVLLIGVGKFGAQSWIDLGPTTIQPSEYAKLACIMVTAVLFCQLEERTLRFKDLWSRLALSVGGVIFLVMLQPDMGTTMSIVLSVYLVLLLAGVRWTVLLGTATVGMAGVMTLMFAASYRAARMRAFLNPWADPQGSGYQSIQAMLAFGSGGIDGVGLGLSRQKFFYLPAAHNDFIFAIIGEELGLLGTVAVVAAFLVLTYAGIRIALGTRDLFGRLLAGGLVAMIAVQAVMNMAAVTGLMPVTGITMPLVSYGGSSMTFTMLCVGIVLSVSKYGSRGARVATSGVTKKEIPGARDDERRRNRRPYLSSVDGGRGTARRRA
ncbi:MAG: putative lipid II flippase FtsW [Coriobacteriia bacterium]|nr:putative lipid II flippase FtsW [Coriobacteriia bacterium]